MPSLYPKQAYSSPVPAPLRTITVADFLRTVETRLPANANQRLIERFAMRSLRAWAGIGRVAPWLALGLTLYEAYELYRDYLSSDALKPDTPRNPLRVYRAPYRQVVSQPGWLYSHIGIFSLPPGGHYFWGAVEHGDVLGSTALFPPLNHPMPSSPPIGIGYLAHDSLYPWNGAAYSYNPFGRFSSSRTTLNLNQLPVVFPILPADDYHSIGDPYADLPPVVRQVAPSSVPASPLLTIDPFSVPIYAPDYVPSPIPYSLIPRLRVNPWRAPEYQRSSGYALDPVPSRPVASLPLVVPTVAFSASPDVAARSPRLASYHSLRPPSGGDKERKVRASGAGLAIFAIRSVTESVDAIEAVWNALPTSLRSRRATPQQMLVDLYQHWDSVDLDAAVQNLLLEHLSDLFYGLLASGSTSLSRKIRPHGKLPIGYQAGPAL